MKKNLILLIICLFLITCGCGGGGEDQSSSGNKETVELTIGIMPDIDSVPFVIAQEKGYFKEVGIKVKLQQFKSAVDRDAAFQSGNIDGAISDLLAVAFAKSGGFDVKVTSMTDGCYSLVAGKDITDMSVQSLTGKDIAVSRNTIIEYVTDRVLSANQMDADSINKVVIPQIPVRLEMLQNGKISGATLPEPMASIAVHNGCRMLTGSDRLGINPGVIMFNARAVNDKKAALQAMYKAYDKAVDYLNNTDKKEYMELVVQKNSFPKGAENYLKLPKYHKATQVEKDEVDAVMNWMLAKKLIKQVFTLNELSADVLAK